MRSALALAVIVALVAVPLAAAPAAWSGVPAAGSGAPALAAPDTPGGASGETNTTPRFELELEGGPVWQAVNDLQIPNDETGTRFSAIDVIGNGPWPAVRLYATWNISDKHGVRALLAPLTIEGSGTLPADVNFAGETFEAGRNTEVTYKFNSWRLGYRYRFVTSEHWRLWIGITAKIRDAKVRLEQEGKAAEKTDVGFVPLLHFFAEWRFAPRWRAVFDFEGLAGGPGRAFDVALKASYDLSERWFLSAGYRTVEGGADVDEVYSFAWLNYAVLAVGTRF